VSTLLIVIHDTLAEPVGGAITVLQCEVFCRAAFQVHADGVRLAHAVLVYEESDA
jgi:hypothetical protein